MLRFESLDRSRFVKFALLSASVLVTAGLLIAVQGADGKKKGKGKGPSVTITVSDQSSILDGGNIGVKAHRRGRVVVQAVQANGASLGPVTKKRSAKAGKAATLALTDAGRKTLGGCSVDSLRAVLTSRTRKGTRTSRSTVSLNRDLAICSVGSENPTTRPYHGPAIPTDNADRCDFIDPAVCLQPWPNDYFTVADGTSDTGRRLNLNQASMPKNTDGTPIGLADYNNADGFSPGNMIIVKVPGVSTKAAFDNSGFVTLSNPRRYDDDNQPVVVINTDTGERQPVWAELDANPDVDGDRNIIIRAARNFDEGAHYIVALRGLRDAQNNPVDPPAPFRVYRDRLTTSQGVIENRRPQMESIISTLQQNGFQRSNLYIAWDFTVASEDSLSGRAVAMRDDALSELGDTTPGDGVVDGTAPTFTVDTVVENPNANTLRQIDGTLTNVPCYLNTNGCGPNTQFAFAPGAHFPTFNPAFTANVPFRCVIPVSVIAGGTVNPAHAGTYGHGLLGSRNQVTGQTSNGSPPLANRSNSVWCAVNWAGFSDEDTGVVLGSLADLSNFHKLVDRMQQGFVNFTYLGRAMIHPGGFITDPAFQADPDGVGGVPAGPAIDTNEDLTFEGISQGAIMGGALTALSPDFTRAVLNVTGMNYSTLLRRSVDFDEYAEGKFNGGPDTTAGLYDHYPSKLERPLILSLMQLLWDRGEANGYAHHMTTDPLPNTPEHQVLLQVAAGDHQVSNITAEVEARTIGARIHLPAVDPGRHWDVNPFMQIPAIGSYPFSGSALVYYDGGPVSYTGTSGQGSGVTPTDEVPPRPELGFGGDPHGYPRRSEDGLTHATDFLYNGFINPCVDPGPISRPCYANGWTGP